MKLKLDQRGFNFFADKSRSLEDIHDKVHDAYTGKMGKVFKDKTRKRVDWVVNNTKGKRVLDVGCSQGTVPILLGQKGFTVAGIDIDSGVIRDANQLLSKEPHDVRKLVSFIHQDFLEFNYGNDRFDAIIFSELLEHLPEPEVFIKRAYELLENRGQLIITVPFGINDHPDHRQVFYLGEVYSMVSKYFSVSELEIIEKWIGLVAEKNSQIQELDSVGKKYVAYGEKHFYEIERSLEEKVKALKEKHQNLSKVDQKNRQLLREANRAKDELINIRSSRKYRIAQLVVSALKRPRRFLLLPYRIVKVMVNKPLTSSLYVNDPLSIATARIRRKPLSFNLRDPAVVSNKKLKVATILDDFSYSSFSPECVILQLTPKSWQIDMDEFKPDMLLVESAWRGAGDQWQHLVSNMSKDLDFILKYCQEKRIPTVFWCKEDPVHFERFINTAKYFDYIFTSDAGSIDKYRQVVNHDRAHTLRFAAQPIYMNPIEKYDRKDAVCFAGTYYVKYRHRAKEFEEIVDELIRNRYGVEIYDRNYHRGDVNYEFPDKYRKHVLGTLPFDEIDKAYKGYKYALTMNTIQNSTTMFARRAYELLASNTITISNYCLGIKTQLGDLVISAKRGKDIVKKLKTVTADESYARKFKLMGVREVLNHHTYDIRLSEICNVVFSNYQPVNTVSKVSVIAEVKNEQELEDIIDQFNRQIYGNKELAVAAPKNLELPSGVSKLDKAVSIGKVKNLGDYVLVASSKDYYGENFLLDLVLATKYSGRPIIGKSAYYKFGKKRVILKEDGSQYQEDADLLPNASIIKSTAISNIKVGSLLNDSAKAISNLKTISIDEFSYCQDGARMTNEQVSEVEGVLAIDVGVGGHQDYIAGTKIELKV